MAMTQFSAFRLVNCLAKVWNITHDLESSFRIDQRPNEMNHFVFFLLLLFISRRLTQERYELILQRHDGLAQLFNWSIIMYYIVTEGAGYPFDGRIKDFYFNFNVLLRSIVLWDLMERIWLQIVLKISLLFVNAALILYS